MQTMKSNERNQSNIRFIEYTLGKSGQDGFKAWFDEQHTARQEYTLELLDEYILQLNELRQSCSGDISDATKLLRKFTTKV